MLDSTARAAGAGRPAPDPSAIAEIVILWLTAGRPGARRYPFPALGPSHSG